jgi:protein-disulfide isomerase
MRARLKLIALMFAVVLGGFAVGATIDAFRLPGVELDRTDSVTALLGDRSAPYIGPPRAARTVVIFTDYQCGICRLDHAGIETVVRSEPRTRFVFKEWSILGPQSRAAAEVALAARYQGRYLDVRDALMRAGQLTPASIRSAVVRSGANWPRLQADLTFHRTAVDRELARTSRQAFALGLRGTPSYMIDTRLVVGSLRENKLRRLIDREPTVTEP